MTLRKGPPWLRPGKMTLSIFRKIDRSLRRRGFLGTLRHAVQTAPQRLWGLTPSARRARLRAEAPDRAFDLAHGVDTAGPVQLAELNIKSANWPYGTRYEPIGPGQFRTVIEAAEVDFPRYTFVDFGSGKGRALLLASEYPFRKIIGVEFAPELAEIARRNLCNYSGAAQRCRQVEVVCRDATEFPIPDGPTVCFFHNPFEAQVMAAVVANVRQSLEHQPREMIVLYVFPFFEELWSEVPRLRKVKSGTDYSIYRVGPEARDMQQCDM
jgi:SAM-dependent methyltransferase